MDPNASMKELLEAVRASKHDEVSGHAQDLEKWLETEGFMPEITREQLIMFVQSVDMLARRLRREQKQS